MKIRKQAKNKNSKVEYVSGQLSQWPFHIPNSEN